jgi:tetratricopeptide (TPR) repeat protein
MGRHNEDFEAARRAVERAEEGGDPQEVFASRLHALALARESGVLNAVASLGRAVALSAVPPGCELEALKARLWTLEALVAATSVSAEALETSARDLDARAQVLGAPRSGARGLWLVADALGVVSGVPAWASMEADSLSEELHEVQAAALRGDVKALAGLSAPGAVHELEALAALLEVLDRRGDAGSSSLAQRLEALLETRPVREPQAYEVLARHQLPKDPEAARDLLEASAGLVSSSLDPRTRLERAATAVLLARRGLGGKVLGDEHLEAAALEGRALEVAHAIAAKYDRRNLNGVVSSRLEELLRPEEASPASGEDWDAALEGLLAQGVAQDGPALAGAHGTTSSGPDPLAVGEAAFKEGRARAARSALLKALEEDVLSPRAHEILFMTELLREPTQEMRAHVALREATSGGDALSTWMKEFLDAFDDDAGPDALREMVERAPVRSDADRGVLMAGAGVHAGDDALVRAAFVLLDDERALLSLVHLHWWSQRAGGRDQGEEVAAEIRSSAYLLEGLSDQLKAYHQMEWDLLLARVVGNLGHHDQTRDVLDRVLEAADALGEDDVRAEALLNKGQSLAALGDLEDADSALTQAAIFGGGPRWLKGQVLEVHVDVLIRLGRGGSALNRVEDALSVDHSAEEGYALKRLRASALVRTGAVLEGVKAYETLVEELREEDQETLVGMLLAEVAGQVPAFQPGLIDPAETMLRAAEAFSKAERPYEQVQALKHATNMFNNSYREERALETVRHALTLAAANDVTDLHLTELHLAHAAVLRDVNRGEDALAVLDVAYELTEDDAYTRADVLAEKALALTALGRGDEAVSLLEDSLEEATGELERMRLTAGLAAALERTGRVVSAARVRRVLRELEESYEALRAGA